MGKSKTGQPKLDLVKAAKNGRPKCVRGCPGWITRLPPSEQESLEDLKRAHLSGELVSEDGRKWEAKSIYEQLVLANGIKPDCSYQTFRAWLGDYYG